MEVSIFGRYETGNVSGSNKLPVVRRMNVNLSDVSWYGGYKYIPNIEKSANVKTSMIWGCLWDETAQWLVDSGTKTYADIATTNGGNGWGTGTRKYTKENGSIAKSSGRIPSGSSEIAKACGIYDLVGNVAEYTYEQDAWNTYRVRRGPGNMTARSSNIAPMQKSTFGVRSILYIK